MLWRVPIHETVQVEHLTPPDAFPAIDADHRGVSPVATGVAGLVGGALIGAGIMAGKKLAGQDRGSEKGD
jgi:hydrogenase small subunit